MTKSTASQSCFVKVKCILSPWVERRATFRDDPPRLLHVISPSEAKELCMGEGQRGRLLGRPSEKHLGTVVFPRSSNNPQEGTRVVVVSDDFHGCSLQML